VGGAISSALANGQHDAKLVHRRAVTRGWGNPPFSVENFPPKGKLFRTLCSAAISLQSRSAAVSLQSRSAAVSLQSRSAAVSLQSRSAAI